MCWEYWALRTRQSAREGNFNPFIKMAPPEPTTSKPSEGLLQRIKARKQKQQDWRIQTNQWVAGNERTCWGVGTVAQNRAAAWRHVGAGLLRASQQQECLSPSGIWHKVWKRFRKGRKVVNQNWCLTVFKHRCQMNVVNLFVFLPSLLHSGLAFPSGIHDELFLEVYWKGCQQQEQISRIWDITDIVGQGPE